MSCNRHAGGYSGALCVYFTCPDTPVCCYREQLLFFRYPEIHSNSAGIAVFVYADNFFGTGITAQ